MARTSVKTLLTAAAVLFVLVSELSAHPPWGVAVDPQSQVYFSDLETVWKIDARGRLSVFRARATGEGGRHTHELNCDEAGNVYGEDLTYEPGTEHYIAAVWKMTPAGVFSYVVAPTDDPPKGMSIWRGRDGSTYATLRRDPTSEQFLLKRSPEGTVNVLAGDREAAERVKQVLLYGSGGMAFGADGTLYFVDGASLMKMTPDGVVSALARDIPGEGADGVNGANAPQGSASAPRPGLLGIAVDASGNVYAADLGGRRVVKVTPRGEVSTLWRSEQPWLPTGVAVRGGDVYVLEAGAPRGSHLSARVRKLSPDGRATLLATAGENVSQAAGPSADTSDTRDADAPDAPARRVPYVFIALAGAVFILAFFIWLASRSRAGGRLGANHDRTT
ncbi:MAG TPA: hypothetical protein VJ866_00440 [Pyrinomonadaceae bacterium]|nr:hypothetical protein [Pyrinomonadaceae bacterium]